CAAARPIRQGQHVRRAPVRRRGRRRPRTRTRQQLEEPVEVRTDQNWLLSLGTFLPLAGVLVMLFIPRREETLIKAAGIVTAAATVGGGLFARLEVDYGQASKQQFFASADWIRPIRATYTVGLDGIS